MGDTAVDGLPAKNPMGQPWRAAFALQGDGVQNRAELRGIERAIDAIYDAYDGNPPDKVTAVLQTLADEWGAAKTGSWILRSAIVWHKVNPMPESVTDRPTNAYEMVFLLAKSNTSQFWTHRDAPGTRTRPAPDYRWQDALTGLEYAEEPADLSDDAMPCPDCGGDGQIVQQFGQVSMFDGVPELVQRLRQVRRRRHGQTLETGQPVAGA